MSVPKSCPQNDVWQQLLTETLAAEEEARLVTHLDHCTQCQDVLESLAGGSDLSGAVARHLSCQEQSDKEQLQPWIDRLKQSRLQLQTEVTEKPDGELLDFLEPTDDPHCLGSLGRYRVTQIVGQGGMGLVLKAIDPALSRVVAIKVLAPRLANDRTSRRRFLREARAAAAVAHDHVVTIYSVGKRGDILYLEMQYIEGCSLQEKLEQQGPLDPAEILQIGLQTARGLAAAHARGLIHRDIKPANILLEQENQQVKISDFGLACVLEEFRTSSADLLIGTPEYMAPEQTENENVDHRADLFCLGSVLYAMCTGHSPFAGGKSLEVMKRVAQETYHPVPEINPAIPPGLIEIIDRLLAKDPAQRIQSAEEVSLLLETEIERSRISVPPDVAAPAVQSTHIVRPVASGHRSSRRGAARRSRRFRWQGLAAMAILVAGFSLLELAGVTSLFRSRQESQNKSNHRVASSPGKNNGNVASKAQPFLIVSADDPSGRTFAGLAEAIDRAQDGETIEIHGHGPYLCQPLDIVDKRLRIRAAAGFRPVLEMQQQAIESESPLLRTNQRLVLEGIVLQRLAQGPAGSWQPRNALLKADRCELWIAHCRFVFNQRLCGIRAEQSQLCRIRNCEFITTSGVSVGSYHGSQGRLFLHNNVMTGDSVLLSEFHARDVEKALVMFSGNTVFSRDGIELVLYSRPANPSLPGGTLSGLIRYQLRDNVFRVEQSLVRVEQAGELARSGEHLSPRIRGWLPTVMNWDGEENLYHIGRQYVRVTLQGNPAPVGLMTRDLADWQGLWAESDVDSASGQVEFTEPGLLDTIADSPGQVRPSQFQLAAPQPNSAADHPRGADVGQVGPGKPYQHWRKTSEYLQWQQASGFAMPSP